MTIEAKLIDKIGWRTKPDLAASQAVQSLRANVEPRASYEIRHLLANIVFAAEPRWRAGAEEASADAGSEDAAVEITLGHLFKALAADDRADFVGHAARPEGRQRRLLRLARTGDAAQWHADFGRPAVVVVSAQFSFVDFVDELLLADAVGERAQAEGERIPCNVLRGRVVDGIRAAAQAR